MPWASFSVALTTLCMRSITKSMNNKLCFLSLLLFLSSRSLPLPSLAWLELVIIPYPWLFLLSPITFCAPWWQLTTTVTKQNDELNQEQGLSFNNQIETVECSAGTSGTPCIPKRRHRRPQSLPPLSQPSCRTHSSGRFTVVVFHAGAGNSVNIGIHRGWRRRRARGRRRPRRIWMRTLLIGAGGDEPSGKLAGAGVGASTEGECAGEGVSVRNRDRNEVRNGS